jgi:phage portal protein BeeE
MNSYEKQPELYKVLCNRPSEEENRHRWQSTTH